MSRIHVRLRLEQPCVASATSVSEGGHSSLPFIRGRALLGAVARRFEEAREAGIAWDVFFSGRVRFSDARVLDPRSGAPCLPVPLSWHAPKGHAVEDLVTHATGWADHAVVFGAERAGGVALGRSGRQLGPSGRLQSVATTHGLRTAVDHDRQAAATSQLFGYEAITAGTTLGFHVDMDLEGVPAAKATALLQVAFAQPLYLGRSRSAEYGRARAEIVGPWPLVAEGAALQDNGDAIVLVLCASEVEAHDAAGRPGAIPAATELGLPVDWRLDHARTFVRRVRWAPFNGHWRRRDVERIALEAGSVLAYRGPAAALDLRLARGTAAAGVGSHRAEGLGRVILQPALLGVRAGAREGATATALGFLPVTETAVEAGLVPWPDDPLGAWARARHDAGNRRAEAHALAERFVKGLPPKLLRGSKDFPGASQWRRLAQEGSSRIGRGVGAHADLRAALFRADAGLCVHGVSKRQWNREVKGGQSLVDLLGERLSESLPDADIIGPLVAALVGASVAHAINQGREGGQG